MNQPKIDKESVLWLSFDVEASGPIPGLHSMLSLGISAWQETNRRFEKVSTFSCNFKPLTDATWDFDTRAWWNHPDREQAYRETTKDPVDPLDGMIRLVVYLESLPKLPHIWAAYPATFDMPFVRYYAQRFVRDWWTRFYSNPMERIACFDIGSYAMRRLGCSYHEVSESRMPPSWFTHNRLPHVALNDAEEQAHLLRAMLADDTELLHNPAIR